jgi:predicted acetyltransferase
MQLRLITSAEVDAFGRSAAIPFLDLGGAETEHWARHLEIGRTWAVVDRDRFVANCCVFTRNLTLPGSSGVLATACPTVPIAAVSGVGVHPTHRRQGWLTKMMDTMLDDARRRGEPLAALLASESGIYGRYGFGMATTSVAVAIDPRRSAFATEVPSLDLQLMGPEEAAKVVPDLFDGLRRTRAGQVDRTGAEWTERWTDPKEQRQGGSALYAAVCDQGYLTWRAHKNRLVLEDLYGANPEVEASLWRFLLDIDLVAEVTARHRPTDEALRWRLADPRQLRVTGITDFLWVRILDVPAALEARGYGGAGRLVLDVLPSASPTSAGTPARDPAVGRFVLEAGPDGASGQPAPIGAPVDLRLGVADLGSLLLGGVSATTLAAAGRVAEDRPGALALADRLFSTAPAPYTGTGF